MDKLSEKSHKGYRMSLFTVYSDKEMQLLASLPSLTKKVEINFENISIFDGLDESDLKEVLINKREIFLKEKETFKSDKIIWVVEGELGLIELREIKKRITTGYGFKKFFNKIKKEDLFIALKPTVLIEFEINEKNTPALCTLLKNICKVI